MNATSIQAFTRSWLMRSIIALTDPLLTPFLSDADMPHNATGKSLHRVLRQRLTEATVSG
ncbi:hypothetical protein [Hydrogenophaga sp.]|jgi:hypothetical protein|uniref:hypothetical protein n=1 Tax=Hydrogenophaga sp. TaxID=1904254 RepID=UPI003F6FCDEF